MLYYIFCNLKTESLGWILQKIKFIYVMRIEENLNNGVGNILKKSMRKEREMM